MDPTQAESSKKRARIEKSAPAALRHLVLCFLNMNRDWTALHYSFEFFPLKALLDYKKFLEAPARTLTWPDDIMDDSACPNMSMSFRHSRLSLKEDPDGLGVLYAVGGLPIPEYNELSDIPESLPNKLTRITLSGYRMLDDCYCDTYMSGGKLFPLIEEIDHLIYVLSGPTNSYGPDYEESKNTFEVYNPRGGKWRILAECPLISSHYKNSPFVQDQQYAHLVLGQKLFVSDGQYSCVYDIVSNTWNACHLFSNCYIPEKRRSYRYELLPGCGPGFPFVEKALLWKDKFLLCIIAQSPDIIAAFRIDKDEEGGEEKVVSLKLCIESTLFLKERGLQLVDIGEDHFALMVLKRGGRAEGYMDRVCIFTFKLEIDATTQDHLLVKDLNMRYSKADENNSYFNSSFAC